jgi:hypothetical protein
MHTRARTVEIANNVGHARLVAHSSGQVDGFLGVILHSRFAKIEAHEMLRFTTYLGERLNLSTMTGSPFSREKTKGAVAGSFILTRGLEQ